MMYYAKGFEETALTDAELREGLLTALEKIGGRKRVLAVPPDITRFHSFAGPLTRHALEYYGRRLEAVLPAVGTHTAMTREQAARMFDGVPFGLFRDHDWRNGTVTLGEAPADFVREVSGGAVDYSWPAQVDRLLVEGGFDLILSIGQVVPHEVVGMANHNKNIFVGTGGPEGINKSHFLGAAYGMEKIMGRADTPVRRVLNYASDFFGRDLPILYVQTVVGKDDDGAIKVRGLFIGEDTECFEKAAELSLRVNFTMLDEPLKRAVVYLDPHEYKSTWLGNKSIYRTRMAMADGGELTVLAPGVCEFGEDREIDSLIRKYGYIGTPAILEAVGRNEDLRANLSAAAHLIHGSSEGRFTITYCPGKLSRSEIENAGFKYADLNSMLQRYNPECMKDGRVKMADGEEVFFISNPGLGLWSHKDRFKQ